MKLEDISIQTTGVDWQKCLQHWSWLLEESPEFTVYIVTKFAELIVYDDSGAFWFLSTSAASYQKIAESEEDFFELVRDLEDFDSIFMPQVISLLEADGKVLGENECYGFITPSVFQECTYDSGNFKVAPVEKYLIGLGDMLGQLKDTPSRESVAFNVVP